MDISLCQGANDHPHSVSDAMKSFPSGYAQMSCFAAAFIIVRICSIAFCFCSLTRLIYNDVTAIKVILFILNVFLLSFCNLGVWVEIVLFLVRLSMQWVC